jgi:hypothetical protein
METSRRTAKQIQCSPGDLVSQLLGHQNYLPYRNTAIEEIIKKNNLFSFNGCTL